MTLSGCFAMAEDTPLDQHFAAQFARSGLVAAGFGVQEGQNPPEIMVGGTLAKGSDTPVPVDAAWHIGSITKSFTAALIMMAVSDGVLSLDRPLPELLPDQAGRMHPSWHSVNLRQLLSHTAGTRPNPTQRQMRALYSGGLDRDALLTSQLAEPLPGGQGRFSYSNIGYILAPYIYEVATGTTWEAALRDRIVGPLGLTSFGIGPPAQIQGHRSILGFGARPVDPAAQSADNPAVFTPAGRMHLSIADGLRWGRFLLDACKGQNDLLSAEACAEMVAPVTDQYGLGIASFPIAGTAGGAWGHGGSNTMWYAILAMLPAEDIVVFAVTSEGRERKLAQLAENMMQAVMAR
ncbi:serine hydrolase domain-containing protein [Yoonia sp. BS5-3]|uniref:Serine hydrolase domain-containing protein n=1 Tax=Yoonia phaeophyticola TaxID=3137369 RepID=A0ABZ2V7C5_9RHOB